MPHDVSLSDFERPVPTHMLSLRTALEPFWVHLYCDQTSGMIES